MYTGGEQMDYLPYYYSRNQSLTIEQMKHNALFFRNYMLTKGWTINAICGLMGNIQSESRCNPGAWEDYEVPPPGTYNRGFGLTQWTPYLKLSNFATAHGGLILDKMETQMECINWEVNNPHPGYGNQYTSNPQPPYQISFANFKISTADPYWLAGAFLVNYERPLSGSASAPTRGNQALAWWDFYQQHPMRSKKMPLWMYMRRF